MDTPEPLGMVLHAAAEDMCEVDTLRNFMDTFSID